MIGRGSLWSVSAVVAGCLLPLACGPAEPPAPAKPSAEARAKAALVPLKQQLMGELTRAMADAGPAGTQLDAAVRQKLAELYPEDRATGFAPGELRGMFWVTVPEATQDPGS